MFSHTWDLIFQAIENLDPDHQCVEYWSNKHETKVEAMKATDTKQDLSKAPASAVSGTEDMQQNLEGLFNKASTEELTTMHQVLSGESQSDEWRLALTALTQELQRKHR